MTERVGPNNFQILVLSGPSGSGKTTVVERLIRESPVKLVKAVSATTRPQRKGEIEAESYYFLTTDEFVKRRDHGEFLETAEVFGAGYWYGTLKSEIQRAKDLQGWAFLEIDVQGALKVIEFYPDALTIFLQPPSLEICEQRLRNRGTDSEETIQRRLRKVHEELALADRYCYQVVNDDLNQTVNEINAIIAKHRV
ncbi:guanylate kinase [Schlesneria paludicola]|uniref:guanylate kinase n=1 Tax=Schlesneria paludicola TaxID=360056 RepID=UPI00029A8C10|nr:guanylate kinase [Schlesneria paludicola]